MARNQKWLWLLLGIALLVLVGALGTSWNLVILYNYEKMVALAEARWGRSLPEEWRDYPWWTIGLGSFGFLSILALSIVMTWKLLLEMRANQAQSEFLALISHELKSPLATLELSSDLLEAQSDKKPGTEKLWRSHKSELQRLKIEIERLLTASRWDGVRDFPSSETLDLNAWILSRESRWRAVLGERSELRIQLPSETVWAVGNSDYLDLIANNLIDNARKFAIDNQAKMEISLSVQQTEKQRTWKMQFQDHGIGFEMKLRRKIFRRFYRAPELDRRSAGSGLGLYIANRAARTLRWKLSASSPGPNQGSCFSIEGVIPS